MERNAGRGRRLAGAERRGLGKLLPGDAHGRIRLRWYCVQSAYHPPPILVFEGIKRFDGNGNLTQRDFAPGRPPEFSAPGTEFGTYTVNPNCTGSVDITIVPPMCPMGTSGDGEIKALIVISDGGRHICLLYTSPSPRD